MITQAELKARLHYAPETGIFTWINSSRGGWNGKEAGSLFFTGHARTAYKRVKLSGCNYLLHRLAFLYMLGVMPERVDHKDEDGLNNRFLNLRESTSSQNICNVRTKANNSSGHKNITYRSDLKNPWRVEFRMNGEIVYRVDFLTLELAIEASKKKRAELHGEFANYY